MNDASRIRAAEFLTPPELRAYRLAAEESGRVGGVRLELLADAAGTRLGSCYQQVPLKVLPPFRFAGEQPSLLYLLNPTAGLMDGDGQLIDISARTGSRALVVGQSATRIHPTPNGFSTQQWRIRVEDGALLMVLPGPAIPFRGCRYYQRVSVELAENAHFIWGDIWLPGRYARGDESERFQFELMVLELAIRRSDRRILRDRFCWHGPWQEREAGWYFGNADACASVFVTGSVPEALLPDAGEWALFPTAWGDTCVRGRGTSAEVTAGVVKMAVAAAAARIGAKPDWIERGDLAPSHWFTVGRGARNDESMNDGSK